MYFVNAERINRTPVQRAFYITAQFNNGVSLLTISYCKLLHFNVNAWQGGRDYGMGGGSFQFLRVLVLQQLTVTVSWR